MVAKILVGYFSILFVLTAVTVFALMPDVGDSRMKKVIRSDVTAKVVCEDVTEIFNGNQWKEFARKNVVCH